MKVGIYCYLTAYSLTNVLQNCSLSSPLPETLYTLLHPLFLPNMSYFCLNLWIWLVAMATERLNLRKFCFK